MELKEIRKKNKLTQQECAETLGVSRRKYQSIENKEEGYDVEKYDYYCGLLASNLTSAKNEAENDLRCDVQTGEELNLLYEKVQSYKERDALQSLRGYIENDFGPRVCILYGLRRTGKTTMLFQLLNSMDHSKAAYIKVKETNSMGDLIKDINTLYARGIRYLLIDEVTLLEDFINTSATLSDIYCAKGMKIILSGTDSLGFAFARNDELYDRCIMIHTSYIPFKEFYEVLGIFDIDEYIEYGGTMKKENMTFSNPKYDNDYLAFANDESTRRYIDTAICRNIQRTLRNNKFGNRFAYVRDLYDKDELTNAINRILENMNHDFLISVVTEQFKSHDLGSSRQMLTFSKIKKAQTALYEIDEEKVLTSLKQIIGIKEKNEQKVVITQEALKQIKEYLYELDLLTDVEVRYSDGRVEERPVFTQPGMRYSIAKALVYALKKDDYIKSLSASEQNYIVDKILSDVKGRMLEDIVLLERTRNKKEEEDVYKYVAYNEGEYDMVVYNAKTDKYELYEIKHTENINVEQQARYLNSEKLFEKMSRGYGSIDEKCVLYRGNSTRKGDIAYVDVKNYLRFHC